MKFDPEVEKYRIRTGIMATLTGDQFGMFDKIPGPCGRDLRVMASEGNSDEGIEWEHVSVSLPNRCPNWPEMCFVKNLFWAPQEVVMQLHPADSDYINDHRYCLHMWRPLKSEIPLPPLVAV